MARGVMSTPPPTLPHNILPRLYYYSVSPAAGFQGVHPVVSTHVELQYAAHLTIPADQEPRQAVILLTGAVRAGG